VSHKSEVRRVIEFMLSPQCWNLKQPKMLISVTGGAKFSLNAKLKDVFRKGLVKAALSTGIL
jgi:hypothetical protein